MLSRWILTLHTIIWISVRRGAILPSALIVHELALWNGTATLVRIHVAAGVTIWRKCSHGLVSSVLIIARGETAALIGSWHARLLGRCECVIIPKISLRRRIHAIRTFRLCCVVTSLIRLSPSRIVAASGWQPAFVYVGLRVQTLRLVVVASAH